MNGLEIAGGIALILFGIRFLRKGLDRLFGGKLLAWLSRLTASRVHAFLAGVVAGAATPSSTSISLLAVQLLSDPRIRLAGVLALVLGANVGMTVTVQAMAFRIQDYAAAGVVAGVALFLYAKRESWRGVGQCLLALGFIFLAIQWIGQGAAGLADSADARQFFALLQGRPWFVLLGTLALVVVLQSSTAAIGLGIGLCASGLLGPALLVPWIAGTNTGVGVSTLLAGWSTPEGRRLGVASLLAKAGLSAPLLLLPGLAHALFERLPGDAAQQTATGHTVFNLAVGLLALPLAPALMRLASALVPAPDPGDAALTQSHLDPLALDTPSLALARATRETLRMADLVRAQLVCFWQACRSGDIELARRTQKEDDRIDRYNRELIAYLSHIGGEKSPRDQRWQVALMNFAVELESIGDLLDKHLCDLAIKQHAEGATLAPDDWNTLDQLHREVLARFDELTCLFSLDGEARADAFIAAKRAFNERCRSLQLDYYARLRSAPVEAEAPPGGYFLDYLNGFRRINSHLTGVAYGLARPSGN